MTGAAGIALFAACLGWLRPAADTTACARHDADGRWRERPPAIARDARARWLPPASLLAPVQDRATAPRRQALSAADPWLGEDKLKHFLMSLAITSFSYGGTRAVGLAHDPAVAVAAGIGALAGAGKEVHDRFSGGDFSARDLFWDAVGVTAGALLAASTR